MTRPLDIDRHARREGGDEDRWLLFRWFCGRCERAGAVRLSRKHSMTAGAEAIERAHREASPVCIGSVEAANAHGKGLTRVPLGAHAYYRLGDFWTDSPAEPENASAPWPPPLQR